MTKKIISILTLVFFLFFFYGCYSTRMLGGKRFQREGKRRGSKIKGIVTKTGKWIGFTEQGYAKIDGKFIIGETIDEKGRYRIVRIPMNEVKKVWICFFDTPKTMLRIIGLPLGSIIVSILAWVGLGGEFDPFCPFIYSYDGTDFIMEGEPFAGAISKGFKRTEWFVLKNIKEVDGKYILLVANEVDDIDYIDDIKLIVVDHDKSEIIIPDNNGNIHTISNTVSPSSAFDREGNDITGFASEIDDKFWTTSERNIDASDSRTFKDELIFEFEKPETSNRAKLIFRGGNTLWGAGTISRYLKLYGEKAGDIYKDIKMEGRELGKLKKLLQQNNFFSLDVKVLTKNGWKNKIQISGAPPLTPDHRVYLLDLNDVPGDIVKIKISPPSAFWKIDYLALNFSENSKLEVKEISPVSSKDHLGNDLIKKLEKEDGNYLKLKKPGSRAEIIFKALPQMGVLERTIILKISGYYEIEIDGTGDKKKNLIENIHSKPEIFLKHSISEYLSAHSKIKDNK